jgi:hypothetical protein
MTPVYSERQATHQRREIAPAVPGAMTAAEKTLAADKSRQNATPASFAPEIGPAKKASPRQLPGKSRQKPEKTWKKRRKRPVFREFFRQPIGSATDERQELRTRAYGKIFGMADTRREVQASGRIVLRLRVRLVYNCRGRRSAVVRSAYS